MGKYKRLNICFELTEELDEAITALLHHINHEDGGSEDGYRCEIDFWTRDALDRKRITRDQYGLLRDYYIHGGIYKELGNPAYRESVKTQNFRKSSRKKDGDGKMFPSFLLRRV